jgi:hypothetical protein
MKVLRTIALALFLGSFAFAGNGNDYVRHLEPDGVFVSPEEWEQEKRKKRKQEGDLAFQRVQAYADSVNQKRKDTEIASAPTLVRQVSAQKEVNEKPKESKGFIEDIFYFFAKILIVVVMILAVFLWSPIGFAWMIGTKSR